MRAFFLFISLFVLSTHLISQNLIPFQWTIEFEDEAYNPKDVNLLLSWERQGVSYIQGDGRMTTRFEIPSVCKDSIYQLGVNLRMNIHDIYINKKRIGGDIQNHFQWSAKPKYQASLFSIPRAYLNFTKENIIEITFSELSYTGGISHNSVSLFPRKNTSSSRIEIQINKKEHCFKTMDSIDLEIKTVTKNRATAKVTVKNEFSELVYNDKLSIKAGNQISQLDLTKAALKPGFYEICTVLEDTGYAGDVKWITVDPTQIYDDVPSPLAYHEYWNKALTELAQVKPTFSVQKIDSLCSEYKDGFVIEIKSLQDVTVRAYYFTPKDEGLYPAILHLPGYGYGFEYVDGFKDNPDKIIELALCVRGHGISKEAFPLEDTPGFFGHGIYDKDEMAYRSIFMDCIRAVDFLYSRNEVDKTKVGVFGGSQGGGLAIATAALAANRINACAYFDPFPCDIKNHIKTRTMVIDEIKGFLSFYNNSCTYSDALDNLSYVDVKFLAHKIQCPVYYSTALFDDDCPPKIGFSAFNRVNSEKSYTIYPNDSHIGESGYYEKSMVFFKKCFSY